MTRMVGIMGGMFDPVHMGHLQAATAARQLCQLAEVVLVPCGNPVHRSKAQASSEQRCDMLRLAIADKHWLRLDTRECDSESLSRTYDTLLAFRGSCPEAILHFILGMDAFQNFSTWYRWQDIFELAHLLVLTRPGYELDIPTSNAELMEQFRKRTTTDVAELATFGVGKIMLLEAETSELASTQIKTMLQSGLAVQDLLPEGVAQYIKSKQLYRETE